MVENLPGGNGERGGGGERQRGGGQLGGDIRYAIVNGHSSCHGTNAFSILVDLKIILSLLLSAAPFLGKQAGAAHLIILVVGNLCIPSFLCLFTYRRPQERPNLLRKFRGK